jgi:hypothetical protein
MKFYNTKQIVAIILCLGVMNCYAQTASEKATSQCCNCIEKLNKSNLTNPQKQEKGTECLTLALTENILGLAGEYGYKMQDLNEENGRKIGEQFSLKLLSVCPSATEILMLIGQDQMKNNPEEVPTYIRQIGEVSGTIQGTEVSGLLTRILFQTNSGEKKAYYWLKRFPGDQMLMRKEYAGKKLKLSYGALEYYHAQKGSYEQLPVVLDLRIE